MAGSDEVLQRENAALRDEVERLRAKVEDVAAANANAALEMAAIFGQRQREAEEQSRVLRKALDEAELAAQRKSEFLATVSHELRTPLNGIIGMVTLLEDSGLGEPQAGYASTALESAEGLLEIINDILDFSKLESSELTLHEGQVDVLALIGSVGRLLAPRARPEVDWVVRIDPDVPRWIQGDGSRLRQVLLNLCGNAIKFTEAGRVTVRCSLSTLGDGAALSIAVRDTGCGIPAESVQDVFESFRQVDNSKSRRHGGTGLGLAISRRLVRRMGGDIRLESTLGCGSEFEVLLPLKATSEAKRGSDHADLQCFVDSEQLRTALAQHLGRVDVEAVFPDGIEALDGGSGPVLIEAGEWLPGDLSEHARRWAASGRSVFWVHSREGREPPPEGVHSLSWPLCIASLLDRLSEPEHRSPAAPLGSAVPAPVRSTWSLLVVEDNPVNRLVAKRLLERSGHRVEAVESGVKALDALDDRYDAILMDCQMPGMDGYETTRRIRAAGYDRIPIIALTAHAMPGDRQACLDAGMDDYVSKPIDLPELQAALDRQVGRMRAG